ncbi:MAG: 1-phosphofructokinase [Schleiferilactobacillus perolens]|uniref:1-phosphofructokinase n=1 Tax=Schleiferilactobacillus perolens TaxID=100468 RepID=UPI0039EC432A
MIYTLTLNPAIDLFVDTDQLKPNQVNRTNGFQAQANGKGVNVSFILHRQHVANTAWGIGGGFTLDYITKVLTATGIPNHFVRSSGTTRINVFTHVRETGEEFKQVNPGPHVSAAELAELWQQLTQLTASDWLIISGSFSQGIDPGILVKIGRLAQQNKFRLIIDTSYPAVKEVLPLHPYLIKPNEEELKSWYGVSGATDLPDVLRLGQRAVHEGAQNVLLSMGSDGAALITPTQILVGNAPKVAVLNTAGSGDTMLGTFVAGLMQGKHPAENLKYALAAGSDTARSSWITDFAHVDELLNQITVQTQEVDG